MQLFYLDGVYVSIGVLVYFCGFIVVINQLITTYIYDIYKIMLTHHKIADILFAVLM